ncbi:MAG: tRNA 2-thiouridine(34) synthase MnmA [Pseudomonadota bacterium]|nr:tRNA 2-thiouridine(34) synthase MnmA [Pseudomonadota bacterium]
MRIVVAMSGGVDSSVAAALLHEQGHEVIGIHMKLHDVPEGPPSGPQKAQAASPSASGHCCGLDDALDARRVADTLGIPFYVMNLRDAFKAAVMDDLANAYVKGFTPNPCVQCNGVLKFQVLLARARALGAEALATGHYVRSDGARLYMAADRDKDQSYFLWGIRPEALAQSRFPLGEMTKPEVRAHAERFSLTTAQKPESMEVCFLPDDDHARFIREARPDVEGAGDIVDEDGRVLGRHDGYFRYTVGQRRGLGVAAGTPIYVLRIEPDARRVVVGPADRLMEQGLVAAGVSWIREPTPGEEVTARIRHRGALIPCNVESLAPLSLRFHAPARAVAPGQSVVLYAGDELLGGGVIQRASTVAAA